MCMTAKKKQQHYTSEYQLEAFCSGSICVVFIACLMELATQAHKDRKKSKNFVQTNGWKQEEKKMKKRKQMPRKMLNYNRKESKSKTNQVC